MSFSPWENVLVRWLRKGGIQINGNVHFRFMGDEDILPFKEAKPLAAAKMLEVVGRVQDVEEMRDEPGDSA